ncbi:MAG: FkbM family methyltransferase [Syntrophus sp. (in: bacteria)]|nr:FkbM family methyltransferase [Syntrophus sp. (in: bacteria)]
MLDRLLKYVRPNSDGKTSYAQSGEDLIADFILTNLRINNPNYLDIGAHHPSYLSNTYFFYKKGSVGVCIEPDPELYAEIRKKRKNDLCINAGIGVNAASEADFYLMSTRTLNTFSKTEAERYQSYGRQTIEKVVKIPLMMINDILDNFIDKKLNFVSLDVEGLDYEIIKAFDFDKQRPEVFCIETITYTEDNSEEKEYPIIEYMLENSYMVYADTYINTIFVDKQKWKNR